MSDYVKATNFYAKDALLTGNPDKLIKGAEIDAEYNAIATAVASKANLNSPNFTGTPTVPTAPSSTNTTQAASTAYVTTALANAQANVDITGGTIDNVDITGGTITGLDTDLAVADGGLGRSTLTAKSLLVGNGTNPVDFIAPSTAGNVLTSNGTDWTSAPLAFDKSLSTNGYQKFPGGLIIQWGTTNSLGSQVITFPIAFTTAVFQIHRTNVNQSGSGGSESLLSSISVTGFTISQKGFDTYTGAQTYYWLAIGY